MSRKPNLLRPAHSCHSLVDLILRRSFPRTVIRASRSIFDVTMMVKRVHMYRDEPQFRDHLDRWLAISGTWGDPKLDEALLPSKPLLK
jgi:hypothetical protein